MCRAATHRCPSTNLVRISSPISRCPVNSDHAFIISGSKDQTVSGIVVVVRLCSRCRSSNFVATSRKWCQIDHAVIISGSKDQTIGVVVVVCLRSRCRLSNNVTETFCWFPFAFSRGTSSSVRAKNRNKPPCINNVGVISILASKCKWRLLSHSVVRRKNGHINCERLTFNNGNNDAWHRIVLYRETSGHIVWGPYTSPPSRGPL